jgi:2-amino-4-hydroxy-6-hydroxymethyldihydropteridine diphosphokinase
MGPQDQPDFINAVARLQTKLTAEQLLEELQRIERLHGRQKTRHWGPRTLDLDILLYGDEVIESRRLTVPHPGIAQRNFVLYPLAELDSGLQIPGVGVVQALLARSSQDGLTRLADSPVSIA